MAEEEESKNKFFTMSWCCALVVRLWWWLLCCACESDFCPANLLAQNAASQTANQLTRSRMAEQHPASTNGVNTSTNNTNNANNANISNPIPNYSSFDAFAQVMPIHMLTIVHLTHCHQELFQKLVMATALSNELPGDDDEAAGGDYSYYATFPPFKYIRLLRAVGEWRDTAF